MPLCASQSANCAIVTFWHVYLTDHSPPTEPERGISRLQKVRLTGSDIFIFGFTALRTYATPGLCSVCQASLKRSLSRACRGSHRFVLSSGAVLAGALATISNRSESAHFGMVSATRPEKASWNSPVIEMPSRLTRPPG